MTDNRRDRLVEGAFEALRTKGFAGASARTIAGIADVNPGLIFYYFGNLDELLLAALERSSEARLERYRPAAEGLGSPAALIALLREIYREDIETGHIRVVCEMVSGSVARPELGERVMAQMEPWIDLAESAIARVMAGSPVTSLVATPRDLAIGGVTFYLGANLVSHMGADPGAVERMFDTAERGAQLLELAGGAGR